MTATVSDVPKAELHVHLEGTARPALVRRIAERNGLTLPAGLMRDDDTFAWRDFLDFLQSYDLAASVIRTGEDYRDVTYEYLAGCAAEGAVYVELIASLDHGAAVGLRRRRARRRHRPGHRRRVRRPRHRRADPLELRAQLRRRVGARTSRGARSRSTTRTSSAGTWPATRPAYPPGPTTRGRSRSSPRPAWAAPSTRASTPGPESIRGGMALPGVTRISHGVRAVEDPSLVAELAERGIVLEVCPGSNVALGVFPRYEDHPLPQLHAAGVTITLGSDDPPYFATSIGHEYETGPRAPGMRSGRPSATFTENALNAAFSSARRAGGRT